MNLKFNIITPYLQSFCFSSTLRKFKQTGNILWSKTWLYRNLLWFSHLTSKLRSRSLHSLYRNVLFKWSKRQISGLVESIYALKKECLRDLMQSDLQTSFKFKVHNVLPKALCGWNMLFFFRTRGKKLCSGQETFKVTAHLSPQKHFVGEIWAWYNFF